MEENASITESNAATSEELAASAEQMASQAEALEKLVARFKVNGSSSQAGTTQVKESKNVKEQKKENKPSTVKKVSEDKLKI